MSLASTSHRLLIAIVTLLVVLAGVDATLVDSTLVTGRSSTETIENRNVTTAIGLALVFALLLGYYRDIVKPVAPLVPTTFILGWQGLFTFVFAIPVSALTTVFGFSALLLSPFPILSDFGLLTVGVIGMTLVAALVTLPPTLLVLDELREWVHEVRALRASAHSQA